MDLHTTYGEIAQLARAHGSYPWCRGFESPSRYCKKNSRKLMLSGVSYFYFESSHSVFIRYPFIVEGFHLFGGASGCLGGKDCRNETDDKGRRQLVDAGA